MTVRRLPSLGACLAVGLGLVHRIGQPDRFGLPDGLPDLRKFRRRKVSLAALFREILDPAAGIKADGHNMGLARESEEAAQNPQQPVGLIGRVGILAVQAAGFRRT